MPVVPLLRSSASRSPRGLCTSPYHRPACGGDGPCWAVPASETFGSRQVFTQVLGMVVFTSGTSGLQKLCSHVRPSWELRYPYRKTIPQIQLKWTIRDSLRPGTVSQWGQNTSSIRFQLHTRACGDSSSCAKLSSALLRILGGLQDWLFRENALATRWTHTVA